MQSVTDFFSTQPSKTGENSAETNCGKATRFTGMPAIVAAAASTLGQGLHAAQCGYPGLGISNTQMALSCYRIAAAIPEGSVIETPGGRKLSKLDYVQAADRLSPEAASYRLKHAESLKDSAGSK